MDMADPLTHHAALIAELRSEARALYAQLVAAVGRLGRHESIEGCESHLAKHRAELARLGALQSVAPTPEPAVGNFVCDVCHTKSRGPVGAPCPFEHYPQGHAIAASSAPTATGVCQVEHDNWDGRMICGNPMPCPRHVRLP